MMTPRILDDIPEIPGDRRDNFGMSYVARHSFEFMLAVAAVVAGVSGLLSPSTIETSALGDLFGVLALGWSVMYVVSGSMIVIGLARPAIRIEVAGLAILACGIIGNAVAILGTRGWVGAAAAAFYIGWAMASLIRARRITQLSRIIEIDRQRIQLRLDQETEDGEPRDPKGDGGA